MVYYFTTQCGNYTLLMGKDQQENEELIKYGLPEDVWFHVDDLSSAHVYLRQKPTDSKKLDDLDPDLVLQCASLVKANSIAGCKLSSTNVVYTRWKNLKKTSGMKDGQVGYHKQENVRRIKVEKNKAIVNALNKTKTEDPNPDLWQAQQDREKELAIEKKQAKKEYLEQERQKKKEKQAKEQEKREYHARMERGIQETIERTRLENLQLDDEDSENSSISEGSLMGF